MEKYERRIKYLDYVEYGTKIKNGGFLKTEREGEQCRVQINIRGLYSTDTLPGEIVLYGAGKEYRADRMALQYGTGSYAALWNIHNLAGGDISYQEWCGMEIIVSEHRSLRCAWECEAERERLPKAETVTDKAESGRRQEEPEKLRGNLPEKLREELPEKMAEKLQEKLPGEAFWQNGEMLQAAERHVPTEFMGPIPPEFMEPTPPESMEPILSEPEGRTAMELGGGTLPEPERHVTPPFAELYEDKWTQLEQYYKKIRPFGDRRSFLSITPRDFIVLGKQYQKMVSNSFLLHGYYNYGHVVLSRDVDGGEHRYYLGVPGVYYEREKQVAKMFGFEGFEGAADPSAEGGFGYYMMRVEI